MLFDVLDDVAVELAGGADHRRVSELEARGRDSLGVRFARDGRVIAVAERLEPGRAHDGAVALRVAQARHQEARSALGLGRHEHERGIEQGNVLDPNRGVVDPGKALHHDAGAREPEAPRRILLLASGEHAVHELVDIRRHLAHLGAVEVEILAEGCLGIVDRAGLAAQVELHALAGDAPRPLVENDVALRQDGLSREVHLEAASLDPLAAVAHVDAAGGDDVIRAQVFHAPGQTDGRARAVRQRQAEAQPLEIVHAGVELRHQDQREECAAQASILSTITAVASPPPMQIAAQPRRAPRSRIACNKVTMIRAPEQPIGWPRATAPPRTLTTS